MGVCLVSAALVCFWLFCCQGNLTKDWLSLHEVTEKVVGLHIYKVKSTQHYRYKNINWSCLHSIHFFSDRYLLPAVVYTPVLTALISDSITEMKSYPRKFEISMFK